MDRYSTKESLSLKIKNICQVMGFRRVAEKSALLSGTQVLNHLPEGVLELRIFFIH
jgi:hypothetical protein